MVVVLGDEGRWKLDGRCGELGMSGEVVVQVEAGWIWRA